MPSVMKELDRIMEEQRSEEATRNRDRFLRMRAAGKAYWCVDGTKLFWLTELEAAERRTEASTMASLRRARRSKSNGCTLLRPVQVPRRSSGRVGAGEVARRLHARGDQDHGQGVPDAE